jgi:hypothetical protein
MGMVVDVQQDDAVTEFTGFFFYPSPGSKSADIEAFDTVCIDCVIMWYEVQW